MGRRKKSEPTAGLTMKSEKAPAEIFDSENDEQLEAQAAEEMELLEDDEAEAPAEVAEAKPAKPKRQRRPRKPAAAAKAEEAPEAEEPTTGPARPEVVPVAAEMAEPTPTLTAMLDNPIADAAISSKVLNQVVTQLTDTAATNHPDVNLVAKQVTAVKEISVSICSQLDRMAASLLELQKKHATTLEQLAKEKAAPKAPARIPVWLVATSGLALLLSVVSFSLTQATRHSLLGVQTVARNAPAPTPAQVIGGIIHKPALAATESALPQPRATINPLPRKENEKKSVAAPNTLARKDSTASRRVRR